MTSEQVKRRCFLTLLFIVKSISKNVLIWIIIIIIVIVVVIVIIIMIIIMVEPF